MGLISHYIFIMIASSVLLIVRVRIYLARKKVGLKPNLFHELGVAVFVLFLVGLASQTIIPVWGFNVEGIEFFRSPLDRINLIPFQSFIIIGRIFSRGAILIFK